MIHGDVPPPTRWQIISRFQNSPGFGILLLSEVGGEGLDFQFCDTVVNYDLPWNPMKIEQRIGRIDRYGQKSDLIRVYSLFLKDTIEDRILKRLYERIGVFEESIGDMEVILGEQVSKLQREIFESTLSPVEQEERANAIAMSIEFKRKEEKSFLEQQDNLMGQDKIFGEQFEELRNSGKIISSAEIVAILTEFFADHFPRTRLVSRSDRRLILRPSNDFKESIRTHMIRSGYPMAVQRTVNEKLLRSRGFPITCDGQLAHDLPNLEFVNIRHPFVTSARDVFRSPSETPPLSRLGSAVSKTTDPEAVGEYAFYIYLIRGDASGQFASLVPFVLDWKTSDRQELLEQKLLPNLQDAQFDTLLPDEADWALLEEMSYEYLDEYRKTLEREARSRNDALIDTRIAGLQQTASVQVNRLEDLLNQASNEVIQRMRRAQIENVKSRLVERINEEERRRAFSFSGNLVLAGFLRIELDAHHPPIGLGGSQPQLRTIPRRRSEV